MELLEVLQDKKVEDFTREELQNLALEHKVSFKETTKDATIFKNLVKIANPGPEEVEVKILLPVAGKFLLSASVGDVVSYPEGLATELVESKYAEFVN